MWRVKKEVKLRSSEVLKVNEALGNEEARVEVERSCAPADVHSA